MNYLTSDGLRELLENLITQTSEKINSISKLETAYAFNERCFRQILLNQSVIMEALLHLLKERK